MTVSEFIVAEGNMCLVAAFMGMVLGLEYDCIRVFRRVLRHKKVWTMSLEDIVYWIVAAFQVFGLIYEQGDGVVRVFLLVMMILGTVLYRYAFGRYLVVYVSRILNFVLKPLKKVCLSVTIFIRKKKDATKSILNRRKAKRKSRRAAKQRSSEHEIGVEKREGDAV